MILTELSFYIDIIESYTAALLYSYLRLNIFAINVFKTNIQYAEAKQNREQESKEAFSFEKKDNPKPALRPSGPAIRKRKKKASAYAAKSGLRRKLKLFNPPLRKFPIPLSVLTGSGTSVSLTLMVLPLFLFIAGCAPLPVKQTAIDGDIQNQLKEPKYFSNYREMFKYIANNESKSTIGPVNDDYLFKLAADSESESYTGVHHNMARLGDWKVRPVFTSGTEKFSDWSKQNYPIIRIG